MTQRKLYHPLWTHVPALALIGYIIARFVSSMPLPDRVPLHFNLAGQPDRWGSPWELFAVTVGLSVLYLGIAVLGDELWARQERSKSFNWISLLDELVTGTMAGVFALYGDFGGAIVPPGIEMAVWPVLAVLAASVLEYFRPYVPRDSTYQPEDTRRLELEIGAFVEEGKPWVYWETQNPGWMNWIIVAAVVAMLSGAWSSYLISPVSAVPPAVFALLIIMLYGGMRTAVTPDRIYVKVGLLGIPLLKLRLAELAEVKVHEFSPLREFGGYGIRFNRQMKAYFFRGNVGVLVTTDRDKKYLIGSDHPERLAAVVETARRMAGG